MFFIQVVADETMKVVNQDARHLGGKC